LLKRPVVIGIGIMLKNSIWLRPETPTNQYPCSQLRLAGFRGG
jgi:hypothetical protein